MYNSNSYNRTHKRVFSKIENVKLSRKKSKIFVEYFKSFLSYSTIHGLIYLADSKKHPVEKLVWLAFVSVAMYGTITVSIKTWKRYQENPTVISMERDRFSWNTSFPSATICPTYRYSENKLEQYLEKSTVKNKTALREFLISLASATYSTFEDVVHYDDISPDDYLEILSEFQFEFYPVVSNSGANGYQYPLLKTTAEMGICYEFNSKIAVYLTSQYWSDNKWELVEGNSIFSVHPLDGEVFANLVNMSTGFNIYIHGPYETADCSSKSLYSDNGYFLQVYLTALTIFSSQRARDLSVTQRKCRFHDESNLQHSPAYSYRLCRMECRITLAKKWCGCMPFFYRKVEELITLKKLCNCVPNCDEVNYVVEDLDTREWFLGSNLQWGLKEYPRMRLKRDVIFGFTDVLVYIGGMTGLFLGCSVLSFIEVIYFFTIRLFWFTLRYGQKTDESFK